MPRRLAAALVLALLCCGLLAAGAQTSPAAAAAKALVADSTTGLTDGSPVTLTGSGRKPGSAVSVLQCRKGTYPVGKVMTAPVAYAGHQVERWQADCDPDQPDPKTDNSGRMRLGVADPTGHLTVTSYVSEGTLSAKRTDTSYTSVQVSFTCDETSPCTLVVMDADSYRTLQSLPITFAAPTSTACAAPTPSTPSGVGPYSMTAASCATGTASPLLADYTDTGEAAGLSAFAAGQSDYAFSATGFTGPGGSDVTNTRAAVFTPIAAQAAVIAYDGGSVLTDPVSYQEAPVPVTDLSLTTAEVAALFASPFGTSAQKSPQLVARNPQLNRLTAMFGKQATLVSPDGVIATPDATVLAMTTAWTAVPQSAWTYGVLRAFPVSLGKGTSDTSSIPLVSTLPAMRTRVLGSAFTGHNAPAHQLFLYLTDSATAAQLGLHVAKLQNAKGAFVAPTADSIAAGVKGMRAGPDGVLAPDPANPDAAAYPLPLVQYAVTPHDAFAAKAQLLQFLTYATTTGQRTQDLAPGVFPLPAPLQAAAAASLPLIGAAVPVPPDGPPSGGSAPTGSSGPATGVTPRVPTVPLRAATGLPAAPTASAAAPVLPVAATPSPTVQAIPAFTVSHTTPLNGLLPLVGVAGLVVLLGGATYGSAGRRRAPTRSGAWARGWWTTLARRPGA